MKKLIAAALALLLALCVSAMGEAGLANPWAETTEEGLLDSLGFEFGLPEGAKGVRYRMMESEQLGEMSLALNGLAVTARIMPAEDFEDISGLYLDWTEERDCSVGRCKGEVRLAANGAQSCLWYDEMTGLMYSLAIDGEGADIAAIAAQVYIPGQTE